jgi:hypothetical protein
MVRTLVYWPLEAEHLDESPTLAWIFVLTCIGLGIVASFQNLFLGLGLGLFCLYGTAVARFLLTR